VIGFRGSLTVLMPLEFTPLVRDRRQRDVSFRRIALGRGLRTPQGEEKVEDAETLIGALRAAENADDAAASHEAARRLKDAASRIEAVCLSDERRPFRPNIEALHVRIDELVGVLEEARPDLAGAAPGAAAAAATDADEDGVPAPPAGGEPAAQAPVPRIARRAEARAALDALEAYFLGHEPSSPSFVLVRQARQLVGRPLVEALELLVPERSGRARIDFGSETGFLLTMERMRALSEIGEPDADGPDDPDGAASFTVEDRDAAGRLMQALEGYYAAKEPSSPIPILLTRARGYLNQSFTAILAEFLPLEGR